MYDQATDFTYLQFVNIKYSVITNPGARIMLSNNTDLIIDTGENTLSSFQLDCTPEDAYIDIDPITLEEVVTGCCNRDFELSISAQVNMTSFERVEMIELVYINQDSFSQVRYQMEPCVKMFAHVEISVPQNSQGDQDETYVFFSGPIERDNSYALTELQSSPFSIQPVINPGLIDRSRVSMRMRPWTDSNTGITYTDVGQRTLSAGYRHTFELEFYDIFGNNISEVKNLDPPIIGRFRDDFGMIDFMNFSYENELRTRLNFDLTIHRTVVIGEGGNNTGMLEVTVLGKHIKDSPFMGWTVVPGAYDFPLSPIREYNLLSDYQLKVDPVAWKSQRCYVGEVCSIEIFLVDSACNELSHVGGVLKEEYINVNEIGPYESIDGYEARYAYFRNIAQYVETFSYYFIDFYLTKVGRFDIYLRNRQATDDAPQQASEYPIAIQTFSDVVNSTTSLSEPTYYYVDHLYTTWTALDQFSNRLTDGGVLFLGIVAYHSYGSYDESTDSIINGTDTGGFYYLWGEQSTYTEVNAYTYTVEFLPDRRGFYQLRSYVCLEVENDCGSRESDGESYIELDISPQMIYLTTEFVDPIKTKSTGLGLHTSIVSRVERFLISLFDQYNNPFDVMHDKLYPNFGLEDWVKRIIRITEQDENTGEIFTVMTYDITLDYVDEFNGQFYYEYVIEEPFEGTMYIDVKTTDARAIYDRFVEDGNEEGYFDYVFTDDDYQHVPGSPFEIKSSNFLLGLFWSHRDLNRGGLGHHKQTLLEDKTGVELQEGFQRLDANEPFQFTINSVNSFNQIYVSHTYEEQGTLEEALFFVEFINHEDEGQCTIAHTELQKYCQHLSDSIDSCKGVEACRWVGGLLDEEEQGQAFGSCVACTDVAEPVNSVNDVEQVDISFTETQYLVDAAVNRAGSFHITTGLLQQGRLRAMFFRNPDFTDYSNSFPIIEIAGQENGGINATFSQFMVGQGVEENRYQHSMVISGGIRFDNTSEYLLEFKTNYKMRVYLEGELLVEKLNLQNQTFNWTGELVKDIIYETKIYLWTDMTKQEWKAYRNLTNYDENRINLKSGRHDWTEEWPVGFLQLFESAPNVPRQIILPKNVYDFEMVDNSREIMFVVDEIEATIDTSTFEANFTSGDTVRADQRVMFSTVIKDEYSNIRNWTRYDSEDIVKLHVYRNGSEIDEELMVGEDASLTVDGEHGDGYFFIYTVTLIGQYQFQLTINDDVHAIEFELEVKCTDIDLDVSELVLLGYKYKADDCLFAYQESYLTVDMLDKYGNQVPYEDKDYWTELIIIYFTGDSGPGPTFGSQDCQQYTSLDSSSFYLEAPELVEHAYSQIICRVWAQEVGSNTLVIEDGRGNQRGNLDRSDGFSVEVKAAEIVNVKHNDQSWWLASVDGQTVSFELRVEDNYGNLADAIEMCSDYAHNRVEAYIWFTDHDHNRVSLEYEQQTSFANGKLRLDLVFQSLSFANPTELTDAYHFNFIILNGFKLESGFLVQYFADNNLQGDEGNFERTPIFAEYVPQLSFGRKTDFQLQDLWSRAHLTLKSFSVLVTGLIKPEYTEDYVFAISPAPNEVTDMPNLHNEHNSIDLYLEDQLVTPDGADLGGLIALRNDRWYAFELRYRIIDNQVTDGSDVPEFTVTWESDSAGKSLIMENGGSLAVEVTSEAQSDAVLDKQIGYTF